jgi:polysaccharide pyruvyl transferase WcaK-like protein
MGFPIEPYLSMPADKNIAISVTKVNKDGKGDIALDKYTEEILKLIKKYIIEGYSISMISFEDSIDLPIIEEIVQQLTYEERNLVTTIPYEGDKVIRAMAKAEIIVSTRFHSMVLGALLGKQQIIYSYSNKTANFAKDFGFTVYPVTGNISGKKAVETQFSSRDIEAAKTYSDWMMR